jgi:hypothetical protein
LLHTDHTGKPALPDRNNKIPAGDVIKLQPLGIMAA